MANITVEVISKETIKPSTPTPNRFKNHSLSLIDQYIFPSFVPLIFFYPVVPALNDDTAGNKQHGDDISLLKRSLSETLVHFYPLAGRAKDNIIVDCNDEGIQFIEAKVSGSMCDFLKKPDEQLSGLLPSEVVCMNYVTNTQVYVQVNSFECHSTAISLCVSHKVADVATNTITTFIRCWAQTTFAVSRTTSIGSKLHPTFDSASLFPPIKQLVSPTMVTPTEPDSSPLEESKSISKIISKRFVFDAKMINSVREKVSPSMVDKYKSRRLSRVEIVSALIWKSFVKLATPGSSSVMVRHAVNLRRRIEPPLPDVSFGNILEFTKLVVGAASTETSTTQGSSKLHEELNEFVCQLRESISKMNMGDHDFDMENVENEGRDLWMSSWGNYGSYDIDFGWGKPIWVTTVGPMFAYPDGFYMNDTRCGEGIEVWGNLVEEDMDNFQQNLSELLDRI